jgi:hypothetical protein
MVQRAGDDRGHMGREDAEPTGIAVRCASGSALELLQELLRVGGGGKVEPKEWKRMRFTMEISRLKVELDWVIESWLARMRTGGVEKSRHPDLSNAALGQGSCRRGSRSSLEALPRGTPPTLDQHRQSSGTRSLLWP